ncbi:MAG: DUF177 domain-containing protein [Acidimicrobiia bacterium]
MRSPYEVLVSDLLSGRESSRRVSSTAPLALSLEQAEVEGQAQLDLELKGVGDRVSATGTAGVNIQLTCVRCLTGWTETLAVEVSALFAREPSSEEYPVSADTTVDLEPAVRDDVASAMPLLPLCRPDCAGLCPVCGTDLNNGRCPGHELEEDSPFAALRSLIQD